MMRPAIVDPIITDVQAHQRAAADLIRRARAELRAALAMVRRHPDYRRTERARRRHPDAPSCETLTLAWWVANSIESVLNDVELFQAAEAIEDDLHPEASMLRWIADERRDLARFERKRRRAAAQEERAHVTVAA